MARIITWGKYTKKKETTVPDTSCSHDWETMKHIDLYKLLAKKYGNRLSNFHNNGVWYTAFWIDSNIRIEIKGNGIFLQKVCLLCGKCVDESISFMQKTEKQLKNRIDRKKLAKKLWKECKNVN